MRSKRESLFVPEIRLSLISVGLDPLQRGRAYDMQTVALVHDLIPRKLSGDYSPETLVLCRSYYRPLASADLMIATTTTWLPTYKIFSAGEQLRVAHRGDQSIGLVA